MKQPSVAVDTSVAIPLLVATHVAHAAVTAWAKGKRLLLSGHAAIETYAVLTRLPRDLRVAPVDALTLIEANFDGAVSPTPANTLDILGRFESMRVAGGASYDALVAVAALDSGLRLATRDARARTTYERVGVDVEVIASE